MVLYLLWVHIETLADNCVARMILTFIRSTAQFKNVTLSS